MVCFLSAQLLTTDLRAESAHKENRNHHLSIRLSSLKHEGGNNEGGRQVHDSNSRVSPQLIFIYVQYIQNKALFSADT